MRHGSKIARLYQTRPKSLYFLNTSDRETLPSPLPTARRGKRPVRAEKIHIRQHTTASPLVGTASRPRPATPQVLLITASQSVWGWRVSCAVRSSFSCAQTSRDSMALQFPALAHSTWRSEVGTLEKHCRGKAPRCFSARRGGRRKQRCSRGLFRTRRVTIVR